MIKSLVFLSTLIFLFIFNLQARRDPKTADTSEEVTASGQRKTHFASESLIKDLRDLTQKVESAIKKGGEIPKNAAQDLEKGMKVLQENVKQESKQAEQKTRGLVEDTLQKVRQLLVKLGRNVNQEIDETLDRLERQSKEGDQ